MTHSVAQEFEYFNVKVSKVLTVYHIGNTNESLHRCVTVIIF